MSWKHKIKKGAYYRTEWWRERRKEMIEDSAGCDECGSRKHLQVHHKNYNNLFKEKDSDLVVLCKSCHEDLHGKIFDLEDDDDD